METLSNEPRGCGTLKNSTAYARFDLGGKGVLPPFVELAEYVPHLEYSGLRSWKKFPGIEFEIAIDAETIEHRYDKEEAFDMMVEQGLYDSTEEIPDQEVYRHLDRLRGEATGSHVGEMPEANAHDLLMWIGKSNYSFPQDFIQEAATRGVNRAVPVSKGNEPPTINPGRTRVFFMHPRAFNAPDEHEEDYYPGIIGYSYLSRIIYTEPEDDMIPKYIQEYLAEEKIHDMVSFEDPPDDEENHDARSRSLHEFERGPQGGP